MQHWLPTGNGAPWARAASGLLVGWNRLYFVNFGYPFNRRYTRAPRICMTAQQHDHFRAWSLQTQVTSTVQIAPSDLNKHNHTVACCPRTTRPCLKQVNKPRLQNFPEVAGVCLARSMPVDKTENPKDNLLIMVKHIVYTSFFEKFDQDRAQGGLL